MPESVIQESATKKSQQPDQEDISLSIIPFPDLNSSVPANIQEIATAAPELEPTTVNSPSTPEAAKPEFSNIQKRFGKFFIFLVVVGVLFYGRFTVPTDSVACVEDKVLNGLKVLNDFINQAGHEEYRRAFQILCSLLIDLTFLGTFAYWIWKANSLRFPLTLGVFYIVRAIVQKFWISPFPEGFYWDDPGFPSLVVPYGIGSDFFFSGHSGFMVICALESYASKNKKVSYLMWLILAYTILVLLTYRIHYSIDCFTGVFFADWCFFRVNILCKRLVDPLCKKILTKLKNQLLKEKLPKKEECK